jgi:hypothetical protein
MTDTTLPSDDTLPELLAARARRASDLRLAIDVGGGVLVAAAMVFWRPWGWIFVLPAALCFAAFGLWGIADRAGARPLRALAAVIGVLAAVGLVGAIVALGVGRVIS